MEILQTLSSAFSLPVSQVESAVRLLDEGNTVPFIARYRKEATGALDDQTLRRLAEKLEALRALDDRREKIVRALSEQGQLTDALNAALSSADTLARLEDLYRPFRPKRRTRASIARERGLEPLASRLMAQLARDTDADALAAPFVDAEKGVETVADALAGARDILAEDMSDDAGVRETLRGIVRASGVLVCERADAKAVAKESKTGGEAPVNAENDPEGVYRGYYALSQPVRNAPGHRVLAMNRGEKEGVLKIALRVDDVSAQGALARTFVRGDSASAAQVRMAAQDAWERLIAPSLERELRGDLTDAASEGAIRVFAQNVRQLLMQPPVKGRVTLGVDPGFRTGCKLAVVDGAGKVLETGVGFFTLPGDEARKARARRDVLGMIARHGVTAVAIGNGTASREAEAFVAEVLREAGGDIAYMIVSEAGASVYSASEAAAEEFPQFDVTLRSAVSIARRLQDPLAELVKIDPRALGVGQYQHDLPAARLNAALSDVVEDCVNAVGVNAETASAALLSHVVGINASLARGIVAYREENGLTTRAQLRKVPKLGPRAFEQCAGFLRFPDSREPLDATAVHPESYAAARALLKRAGMTAGEARATAADAREDARTTTTAAPRATLQSRVEEIGISALAAELSIGVPTLRDIVEALMKPGRDPRDALPPPLLRRDVLSLTDLKAGMRLKGTVRNLTDFGAFIDIGVHQDGLAHVSRLSRRFIKHPSEAVSVGDVVDVWVVEVDAPRKRIALSLLPPAEKDCANPKPSV